MQGGRAGGALHAGTCARAAFNLAKEVSLSWLEHLIIIIYVVLLLHKNNIMQCHNNNILVYFRGPFYYSIPGLYY